MQVRIAIALLLCAGSLWSDTITNLYPGLKLKAGDLLSQPANSGGGASRIYFPSSGTAAVTPSSWTFTNTIGTPWTYAGTTSKTSTVATNRNAISTSATAVYGSGRWVYGPLASGTISGTVKGQMRASVNNSTFTSPVLAFAIKIIKSDGTDRAVLLAPGYSGTATTPPILLASSTPQSGAANRSCKQSDNSSAVTLTSGTAIAGDYLVVEVGAKWVGYVTTRTIYWRIGNNGANDLQENETSTDDYVPWIEFSSSIAFQ